MTPRALSVLLFGVLLLGHHPDASAQSLREQTGDTTTAPGSGAAPAGAPASTPARATERPRGRPVMPSEITIEREVFTYRGAGRRDPYKSLMNSSAIRPLLSDLRLMTVAYDPLGSNSVAILRDVNTRQQYRVRVGQQLGRMRVSAIRQKAVQFTIQEYGLNRQETLLQSSDTTKVRNP